MIDDTLKNDELLKIAFVQHRGRELGDAKDLMFKSQSSRNMFILGIFL